MTFFVQQTTTTKSFKHLQYGGSVRCNHRLIFDKGFEALFYRRKKTTNTSSITVDRLSNICQRSLPIASSVCRTYPGVDFCTVRYTALQWPLSLFDELIFLGSRKVDMTFVGDSVVGNGKMYGENRNVYSHRQVIISD